MLFLLLGAVLLSSSRTGSARDGTEQEPAPGVEEVARAVAGIDEAFRSGDVKRIQNALEAAQEVPHPSVVRKVVRGLGDERQEVALATLEALRWLDHPDALEALHRAAKDKKHMKVPEQAAAVLRAIAQHAHPSSIAVLARDPFEPQTYGCLRARILGLGRIRTRESLEALLGVLALTGPGGLERRVLPQMDDMRLSLMMLTGVDQGRSPQHWERWWRANREAFQIPAEPPLLPKELREVWDQFFGLPREYERDPRREDRGQEHDRPRKN